MTPFQFLNRFSFLILPGLLLAGVAGVLAWRRSGWPLWAVWTMAVVIFIALALRGGQATTARYDTPDNIRQALSSAQQPTLVEFFSNY
ncbi:MAG: hypothetical protein ABTQ73_07900 [Caldilineales bacterium]